MVKFRGEVRTPERSYTVLLLRVRWILGLVIASGVLGIGCSPRQEQEGEELPPLLQRYAVPPQPGELIAFPPVPLPTTPEDPKSINLLENPSFEYGDANWTVTGDANFKKFKTDILATDGESSLAVLPAGPGSISLSQTESVRARTMYEFTALMFAPGGADLSLDARDPETGVLHETETVSGPMLAWSRLNLLFATGVDAKEITISLHCRNVETDALVLIDECALYERESENLVPEGTMEFIAEEDQMPLWYLNGQGVWPEAEGYQGKQSMELPGVPGRASSLVRMIPGRKELEGKSVWVSAMIKSVPEAAEPPPITVSFQSKGADGSTQEESKVSPGTGTWTEVAFPAKMPEILVAKEGDLPPFQTLRFERPEGSAGRVYIDEVVVLEVPEMEKVTEP